MTGDCNPELAGEDHAFGRSSRTVPVANHAMSIPERGNTVGAFIISKGGKQQVRNRTHATPLYNESYTANGIRRSRGGDELVKHYVEKDGWVCGSGS